MRTNRAPRRFEVGNAAVEYAFLLPILIVILCGAVDFSRAFYAYVTISSTAHEAAIYASRQPGVLVTPSAFQAVVAAESAGFVKLITTPSAGGNTTMVGPSIEGTNEQVAKVVMTYQFQPLVPIPLSGPVPITAAASAPTGGAGGVPTSTPAATPTATSVPTATATPCTVPNLVGVSYSGSAAQIVWVAASFTGSVIKGSGGGSGTIISQSLPAGNAAPCSASITVYK